MRLLDLRLRNFRQHDDTAISFRGGLTGIIGPNGAGKSTILEAIAWAIYGAQAARGTNDTIRFTRAGPRARVEVELSFALGGHEYRVLRTLNHADAFLDGAAAPVASSLGGVTAYLQSRLGMSRDEFFNTYFTGQKELQFLATMGPADRGRFLSQVLGYERLRRAQDLVRQRRNELRSEIRGLRATLGDPDEIVIARKAAEQRVGEAARALKAAKRAAELAAEELRVLEPRWQQAQSSRDRHRELTHALEQAEGERQAARRDLDRAAGELKAAATAARELAPLRERLVELPAVTEEHQRLVQLARQEEARQVLADEVASIQAELADAREGLALLDRVPESQAQVAAELEELRAARSEAERGLEEKRTAWVTERQDVETRYRNQQDAARELRDQIRKIEQSGAKGICPTCGRPLGATYLQLLEELRDQWTGVVQDGKWLRTRTEQLQAKPDEVAELETRMGELGAQVQERAERLATFQAALRQRDKFVREVTQREARLAARAAQLEALPTGYDARAHRRAEKRLEELREVETRAAVLEQSAGRAPEWERQREEAARREKEALARGQAATRERDALKFSQDAFTALGAEHQALSVASQAAAVRAAEARGEVNTAEQALQSARAAEAQYQQRVQAVEEQETELRYHEELDDAYSELRADLNDQVRPELSEIASAFLSQLTDGRYTSMEIDESYNLLVLDEGEEKPVISGGEEDIANLVLRLSLSQMIAERAGHPLSLLILDEVFGSLDVARRDNVVQLLHALEDRFEQVVLITHIEGIREGLDQVLRVEFDERAGRSVVREETAAGGDDPYPETPMAAD